MEFSKLNLLETFDYYDESISLIDLIESAIKEQLLRHREIKLCRHSACNQDGPIYIKSKYGLLKIALQILFDSFPTGNLPLKIDVEMLPGDKKFVALSGNVGAGDRLKQIGEPELQELPHLNSTILLDLASLITNLHGGQLEVLKCRVGNSPRSDIYSFLLMLPICNYLKINDSLSKPRNTVLKPTGGVNVHSGINSDLPITFSLSRQEIEYLNEIALNLADREI